MTGAITINMILSMPPVGIWAIFIGPYVLPSLASRLIVAVVMALVLPFAFMPLSRRIWAAFSEWGDTHGRISRVDVEDVQGQAVEEGERREE